MFFCNAPAFNLMHALVFSRKWVVDVCFVVIQYMFGHTVCFLAGYLECFFVAVFLIGESRCFCCKCHWKCSLYF